MDALNTVFEIYLNNTTIINGLLALISTYLGLSTTDMVKWVQKHATKKIIMLFAHLILSALLYHIDNNNHSPLEQVINDSSYAKKLIPVGSNLLPGTVLDLVLSNFICRMIVRLSYVAVELYTFITGLPYYVGNTYIPLYVGQSIAWILNTIPPINARNNNWPLYGSVVAICHIVVAAYIFMYQHEIDKEYYVYNDRDIIAFVFGAIYWGQLAYLGNDIDENDDGNFTIKEIYSWYKQKFTAKKTN